MHLPKLKTEPRFRSDYVGSNLSVRIEISYIKQIMSADIVVYMRFDVFKIVSVIYLYIKTKKRLSTFEKKV